jgi:Asp-tRNA(Asn)/Glu-tRNA(Gln) amidotransferase A subunit family amidase
LFFKFPYRFCCFDFFNSSIQILCNDQLPSVTIIENASIFMWDVQNPYVEGGDPCGSSSGSAISVAANMVAVSLGTETDGSILCPSDHNSVVGLKPTVGLTSRSGVIPISSRQDSVG